MPAFFSPSAFEREDWANWRVEVIGRSLDGKFVCREIDKLLPGVFLAEPRQLVIDQRAA